MAEEVAEPVLEEMQKLKVRSLAHSHERRRRERSHGGAARGEGMLAESRVNCEADGRAGSAGGGKTGGALNVTVVYAEKAAVQVSPPEAPVSAPAALIEANACPR